VTPRGAIPAARAGWTLHGARVTVESDSGEAMAYARAHLGAASAAFAAPDLRIRLGWQWGGRPDRARGVATSRPHGGAEDPETERIGKDLFDRGGRLVWSRVPGFEGLTLEAARAGDGVELSASCRYVPRDALARVRYLRASRRTKKTHRTFFKLMYYAFYYPLIWHFERRRGWGLLHASAVERNGRAVILSGMGGVGKSTLALSLLADPSFRFISDNLILHDEQAVYSLPEPVRLDPSSLTAICAAGFAPTASGVPPTAHPKPTYRVEPDRACASADAGVVILLRFTPRSLIRPLGPAETLAHLTAARDLVKEVDGYRALAGFLSMAAADDSDTPVEPARLTRLVARPNAYLLGIGEGEPVSVTLARIREVCA